MSHRSVRPTPHSESSTTKPEHAGGRPVAHLTDGTGQQGLGLLGSRIARAVRVLSAVSVAALVVAGCGGGGDGTGSEADSAGSPAATQPEVAIGADGRPITGAIAAPKPPADPDQATGAYLRGFDQCALADEAVAPPNTRPIVIRRGGAYEQTELRLAAGTLVSEHSNSLGSDLWVYRSAAEAQRALGPLQAAVDDEQGVTVGRVDRALYATRGEGVEPGLRACTEAARAAEVAVAAPDRVQRLTAAEEDFVRGPASELGGWCYQDSMRTGNPGSTPSGARRIARRLEALLQAKPDAQTTGGTTVRQTAAEVVSGLDGWNGCPVSSVGDELKRALG